MKTFINNLKNIFTNHLQDKIDGLSADLDYAVEVAHDHGAVEWVEMNYPNHAILRKTNSGGFLSPEEIAQDLFTSLLPEDLEEIRKMADAHDMIFFHHTLGKFIRNFYQLWDERNPYSIINSLPDETGVISDPLHPDQLSMEIMEMLWNKVHAE